MKHNLCVFFKSFLLYDFGMNSKSWRIQLCVYPWKRYSTGNSSRANFFSILPSQGILTLKKGDAFLPWGDHFFLRPVQTLPLVEGTYKLCWSVPRLCHGCLIAGTHITNLPSDVKSSSGFKSGPDLSSDPGKYLNEYNFKYVNRFVNWVRHLGPDLGLYIKLVTQRFI